MKQLWYIIDQDVNMSVYDEDMDQNVAYDSYEVALEKAKELAKENPTCTYCVAMGWCEVAVPPAKPPRVKVFA